MPYDEAIKIALLNRIAAAIGINASDFFDPGPEPSRRVGVFEFETALLVLRKSFSIADADERRQSMATIRREIDRLNAFKTSRGF